ncbi:MAG: type I DNA topoisomerase [Bacteroidota bacterium]
MSKNLFIVESPAKAKTIEGFLGKDYKVKSSIGHIRDLVEKEMGVDIENDFEPKYEIPADKKAIVAELKKLAREADTVWLATDEDREGEAISWHLFEALGLSARKTKRITYSEITKSAILRAIENPRTIDKNLVDAQQARRVLDRLVGYEISPILWKKVKPSLSAGRVQSVAVRLIVEREREIQHFKSTSSYKVTAVFHTEGKAVLKAELNKKFATRDEAAAFLEKCRTAGFSVSNLETKPARKSPSAPFTTSTLQQEAGRKFGYSVAQTMRIAQHLYENGLITYMRTDSVNLSGTAIGQATDEIKRLYGEKFVHVRQYKTKSKGAQEAHEAIRPTYMNRHGIDGEPQEMRLYDLIWKRTIASQMADAELEKTIVTIKASTADEVFIATGEVIKFEGFLKVYFETREDESDEDAQEGLLPPMKTGEGLTAAEISAVERFTHHPPRYTEASLVKKLEELGIGRPSTYAPTISTIQKRGYVVKEDRTGVQRNFNVITLRGGSVNAEVRTENTGAEKAKLFPTDVGMVVTDFLLANFPDIMDYHFTAKVEEDFDEIAEGKVDWRKLMRDFYKPFHKTVENVAEHSERQSGERVLGKDPKSGRDVIVRIGRFGPMVQIGRQGEEEKQKFASLRKDQRIDSITLEEALDLFKLPRTLGSYEGQEVVVSIGRYGPYIRLGNSFISLPKTEDPYTITFERVKEILSGPRLPRTLGQYEGKDVIVAKGFYGNYIKYDTVNASLPKSYDPFTISLDEAITLLKDKIQKEKEKLIKYWEEDGRVKVVVGRYGPCIQAGKKFFKIPADKLPEELTLDECLSIAGLKEEKKAKKAKKASANGADQKPALRKAAARKAVPKAVKKKVPSKVPMKKKKK